jgi:hypothetical protein
MKKGIKAIFTIGVITLMSACDSIKKTAIVPITPKSDFEDTYTIIWNGKSEAYRFIDGQYVRDETYDYIFTVVQKRYDRQWKSTKTLHRNHPGYDFRGGQRSQAMYFEVAYSLNEENKLSSTLYTSLGNGKGISDIEFRNQSLIIDLNTDNPYYNISKYTPFNKMKITQRYNYEEGVLMETVELYKEKDGKITPFSKIEEQAVFYVKGKLDKAPTTFKK